MRTLPECKSCRLAFLSTMEEMEKSLSKIPIECPFSFAYKDTRLNVTGEMVARKRISGINSVVIDVQEGYWLLKKELTKQIKDKVRLQRELVSERASVLKRIEGFMVYHKLKSSSDVDVASRRYSTAKEHEKDIALKRKLIFWKERSDRCLHRDASLLHHFVLNFKAFDDVCNLYVNNVNVLMDYLIVETVSDINRNLFGDCEKFIRLTLSKRFLLRTTCIDIRQPSTYKIDQWTIKYVLEHSNEIYKGLVNICKKRGCNEEILNDLRMLFDCYKGGIDG